MKQRFAEALRQYRKDLFRVEHDPKELAQMTDEALRVAREALDNSYRYHVHKVPDPERAEMINLINNYVIEAILPPVLEKICRRQLLAERKLELLVHLLEEALDRIE